MVPSPNTIENNLGILIKLGLPKTVAQGVEKYLSQSI